MTLSDLTTLVPGHEFVECWTYGWEQMVEACKDTTPERRRDLRVDAEDVRGAARLSAQVDGKALGLQLLAF